MKKFGVIFLMSCLCLFNLKLMSMIELEKEKDNAYQILHQTTSDRWPQSRKLLDAPINQGSKELKPLFDVINHLQKNRPDVNTELPSFIVNLPNSPAEPFQISINGQCHLYDSEPLSKAFNSAFQAQCSEIILRFDKQEVAILNLRKPDYNPNTLGQKFSEKLGAQDKNKIVTATGITLSWQQEASAYLLKEGGISDVLPNTIQLTLTNSDSDNKPEQVVHITLEQLKILSEKTTTQGIGDNNFAIIKIDGNEVVLKLDDNIRKTFEEKHRAFILQQSLKEEIKVENPTKPTTGIFSRISSRHSIGFLTLGFATTILGFYAMSKLEYWNNGLAPAMESKFSSLFNHLYNALQGTLSRASQSSNLRT